MFTRPAGVEQGCLRPREFESTAALTWISSTSSNNKTYELQNTLRYHFAPTYLGLNIHAYSSFNTGNDTPLDQFLLTDRNNQSILHRIVSSSIQNANNINLAT